MHLLKSYVEKGLLMCVVLPREEDFGNAMRPVKPHCLGIIQPELSAGTRPSRPSPNSLGHLEFHDVLVHHRQVLLFINSIAPRLLHEPTTTSKQHAATKKQSAIDSVRVSLKSECSP